MAASGNNLSPTGQPRPGREPLGDTGLTKARGLVQEILDQVTFHDCPPISNTTQSLPLSDTHKSKSKRDAKSSSNNMKSTNSVANSIANSTLTSTSASNSQTSLHGSGLPRPYSRQRHVLPTILSPTGSISTQSREAMNMDMDITNMDITNMDINNMNMTSQQRKSMQPVNLGSSRFVTSDPSPTSADMGDSFFFNTLHSPSFANSHIASTFSEAGDDKHNNLDMNMNMNMTPNNNHSHKLELPPSQVSIINHMETNFPSPTSSSIGPPSVQISASLPPPPPLPKSPTKRPGQGAEVVMGNLSLAALCLRTLESVTPNINVQIPNPLMAARSRDVSRALEEAESKDESTSSWQREVEMAPTFVTGESRESVQSAMNKLKLSDKNANAKLDDNDSIKNKDSNDDENDVHLGSFARKDFFSSMDEDDEDQGEGKTNAKLLFPDANDDSTEGSNVMDLELPSISKDESDTLNKEDTGGDGDGYGDGDVPNINQVDSMLSNGSMHLSAVEEGDEENDIGEGQKSNGQGIGAIFASPTANGNFVHVSPPESSLAPSNIQSPESKLSVSPSEHAPPPMQRIKMFGSEYARHLSSESPFSPIVTKTRSSRFSKKTKKFSSTSSIAAASLIGDSGSPTPQSRGGMSVISNQPGGSVMTEGFHRGTNISVSTMSSASMGSNTSRSMMLEDASDDILSAAITDILVTHGKDMPPKGYYRISLTSNGNEMDALKQMNTGNKSVLGKKKASCVHINVKKEPKWERAVQRPCVTALTVIFPDKNEFVPPGFCVVRKYQPIPGNKAEKNDNDKNNTANSKKESEGNVKDDVEALSSSSLPANLNYGTVGERVYLCYRRSREGNPITGLIPLQPSANEAIPEGYTVLERSPRNFVADINLNSGPAVFLAFRQRLANLETLRPLPLVLSVHCAQTMNHKSPTQKNRGNKKKKKRLQSYYCTGGTVVPAEVGRFHIMDRSTHPLISPSSVTNRLTLIQASRIKRSTSTGNAEKLESKVPLSVIVASVDGADGSDQALLNTPGSDVASVQYSKSFGQSDNGSIASESNGPSVKDSFVNGILNLVGNISPRNGNDTDLGGNRSLIVGEMGDEDTDDGYSVASSSARSSIFVSRDDAHLQACFDTMDFIPKIETPRRPNLDQKDEEDMNTLLQARIALITPILTACYTQHGGSSIIAVEGLSKLLCETDFFLPDVSAYEDPQTGDRLTLLDLSIQVVCDVASYTARETNFLPCIEFVSEAVSYAEGNVSSRTMGYVIRFYLFVFYFGASVPTASSWPRNKISGVSRKAGLDEANDTLLLSEEDLKSNRGYVPGGAPQAGSLAFKELVSIFLGRLQKMSSMLKGQSQSGNILGGMEEDMDLYVSSLVDGAVHQVDVANYTQLALHQIHRSGGSELFWHDMLTSCGTGLFASDPSSTKAVKDFYITSFALLASLVKVGSGKVRKLSNRIDPVPRDLSSKLLSIELIHHFLKEWGRALKFIEAKRSKYDKQAKRPKSDFLEDTQSIVTMAYNIRRLVVPCLLMNTRPGLEDIKVFRRIMKVVTEIWCNTHIRRHMKIEIGVLIEHFILKFLRLGPQVLPPKRLSSTSSSILNDLPVSLLPQQVCIINEVKTWFQTEPRDILELFLNFDQVDAQSNKKKFHLLPSTHWKITQQLCGAFCTLAEQCTDIISEQIRLTRKDLSEVEIKSVGSGNSIQLHSEEDLREMTHVREGARFLQDKCFEVIGQMTKSLMLCAAASSGANYDLLSKLREKQRQDEFIRSQTSFGKENIALLPEDNQSESSFESDGNMTIKSVSTIGNIVGGILNKKKDVKVVDTIEFPESPRKNRLIPPTSTPESDGDIVEYWQTAIAAERRKNANTANANNDTNPLAKKKPPRVKRPISRPVMATVTPPRNPKSLLISAGPGRSPRVQDDISVLSMADDSIRGDTHFTQKMEDTLDVAFEIMQGKNLKKAFDYLIACNVLTPSPKDIASFLRLYQSRIDTMTLGEFLGEGGKDGDEVEHFNLIRFNYVCAISFVGMNVEQGLRHFLTNCGFKLPGEAQKIDRLMTTFSRCYWEDNAGDHGRCPFHDEDTVFLISFAIIMLNTDLHKTSTFATPPGQAVPKQKQRKKMSKPEFLNNLRGVDNSEDLSKDYLSTIYDSIAANPIAIYRSNENQTFQEGADGKKTIRFSSNEYGHVVQGTTDLAGMLKHLTKNVKLCQELLRGLASHEHPYLSLRKKKSSKQSRKHMVPEDLVRTAFCATWHHFHGTINSALDSAHLDPKGLENCLDVLMYSLCATICLDLSVERNAFASQLVRVKYFRENRGLEEEESKPTTRKDSRIRDNLDYKNDSWYMRIEKAAESYHENAKIAALDEVDTMFKKLHLSLKVDTTLKKEMIKVVSKIFNGQILLNDPTRYFLKEGELSKRCNRTGRNVKYTFFLFSDVLIYAHNAGGMFKIHGELPLHLMKIMNLSGSTNDKKSKKLRSFHLIHPRKSFVVHAATPEEKAVWLDTINKTIGREVKRKARIEGARQASAAYDR